MMSQRPCEVCGAAPPSRRGKGGHEQLVFDGRVVTLCRAHATMAAEAHVESVEDLRRVFAGFGGEPGRAERRSPILRRGAEDRRAFPPRPEGRRASTGRRATDRED